MLTRGSCRSVRRLAAYARLLLGRRWPSGIPTTRAFCLRAPGVRLSALEMVLTGVLSLECCLSSFTSARVQSRRTMRFLVAIGLAISFSFFSRALITQLLAMSASETRSRGVLLPRYSRCACGLMLPYGVVQSYLMPFQNACDRAGNLRPQGKAGTNLCCTSSEEKLGAHGSPQVIYANISSVGPPFAPTCLATARQKTNMCLRKYNHVQGAYHRCQPGHRT
jgi:hypothetical protein